VGKSKTYDPFALVSEMIKKLQIAKDAEFK
jgi:hypothetical protein